MNHRQEPLVTVLMPVYNGAAHLDAAISSILRQTYKNLEFLIIDDGSTDESLDIISHYAQKDTRIKILQNPQNIGLISTLNRGIDLATGQYLARMDADDISLPNRIDHQVHFLQEHPEVGICGTWSQTFNHPQKADWETRFPVDHDSIVAHLLFNTAISHPSAMFDLTKVNQYGLRYSAAALHAEDYDLWVRASSFFQLANVPDVLFKYRYHANQTSNQHRVAQAKTASQIRLSMLSRLHIEPSPDELALHTSLAQYQYEPGLQYLARYLQWTDKLYQQNKTIRIMGDAALTTAFHIHSRNLLRRNLLRHPCAVLLSVLQHEFHRRCLLDGKNHS